MARVGPAITVFGSARTRPDDAIYEVARTIGRRLAEAGFAVITGGGPGAMEGANRGCQEGGGLSVGCNIELPHERGGPVRRSRRRFSLFLRARSCLKYADGFVILPGGFRIDELFEALTLIQTGKVSHFPVVLYGRSYWGGLIDWLRGTLVASGAVAAADLDLFHVTDDADEVVSLIVAHHAQVDDELGAEVRLSQDG
jgi:uncharacterized protein (TIGR00730 family)